MPVNKNKSTIRTSVKLVIASILIAFLVFSCIDKFDPGITDFDDLLVIEGSIIKGDSVQTVIISRTTPLNAPKYVPVKKCRVIAEDSDGNSFQYTEESAGVYKVVIPETQLQFNKQFRLRVNTPDGKNFSSEYETILESAPIDSIYFEHAPYQSSSEVYNDGLQFFVDLKAPNENTRNYRWLMVETWEHVSQFTKEAEYILDLDSIISVFPSDSVKYCWVTENVSGLYSSSTENLVANEKKKIPLHYIGETQPKLAVRYSVLVKQYALSDAAYEYWNKNKVILQESGGLYQTQPSQTKSNITNDADPMEIVLGFFWASSFTQKRIFFTGPLNHRPYYLYNCVLDTFQVTDNIFVETIPLADMDPNPTVILWGTADDACFDCTLLKGTNNKPIFW